MSSNRSNLIAPQVHLLEKLLEDDIKAEMTLLITNKQGFKYSTTVGSFISKITSMFKSKDNLDLIVKGFVSLFAKDNKRIPVSIDYVKFFEELSKNEVINLGSVIDITGTKTIERKIKRPGSIYFDGKDVRICTKDGWKSLKYKE
ncbi:MAG: hypothetical protein U9O94_10965 [Nanoarchaeota archaeon]|nr:hypothetical protein [Nanoarchaeota archaeon]